MLEDKPIVRKRMCGSKIKMLKKKSLISENIKENGRLLCCICFKPIDDEKDATLEHFQMKCKGGKDGKYNLGIAHELCNKNSPDNEIVQIFSKLKYQFVQRWIIDFYLIRLEQLGVFFPIEVLYVR